MDTVKAYIFMTLAVGCRLYIPVALARGRALNRGLDELLDILKRGSNPHPSFSYGLFNDALNISDCIASNPGNCTLFTNLLPENALSVVF
jgi:hypothetical protein